MQEFRDEPMSLQIEQAVQWALEDLLTNKRAPSQADLAVIPPHSELRAILDALTQALINGGETGVKRVFKALIKDHPWLSVLRSRALPAPPGETGEQAPEVSYAGTLLSDMTAKETEYLWYPRLPKGKLVMWDGDPGVGKTTTLIDIAARLTRGSVTPDGSKIKEKRGAVLICLEDGMEDTIMPRAQRAGADLTRLSSLGYIKEKTADGLEYERPFSIQEDLDKLEQEIARVDAALVVIDPIIGVLRGKDTYRDNEVRQALAPLKALAEKTGVCIVMIRHLAKGGYDKLIYMGGGSIGFIGLSRVGMFLVRHPDDENRFLLVNTKNNLAKNAPSLEYSITSDENDHRSYVVWHGVVDLSEQELIKKFKGSQGDESNQGELRQKILDCLKACFPAPLTLQEITEHLKADMHNITVTLSRMVKQGQIERKGKGVYAALSGPPQS